MSSAGHKSLGTSQKYLEPSKETEKKLDKDKNRDFELSL
jgi:hypothetical protein